MTKLTKLLEFTLPKKDAYFVLIRGTVKNGVQYYKWNEKYPTKKMLYDWLVGLSNADNIINLHTDAEWEKVTKRLMTKVNKAVKEEISSYIFLQKFPPKK